MEEIQKQIPARLQEIIEDFQYAEGREKIELLVEYSEKMPPFPDHLRENQANIQKVEECMTPVLVTAEINDGKMKFYFDVPPESPTVRGYAAILGEGLDSLAPEDVLAVPYDFFEEMGLQHVLTSQRMNGISAILAHMKRLALQISNNG